MKLLKTWWLSMMAERHRKSEQKRENRMKQESCAEIQVMEFEGRLYIGYHGTPIIRIERINSKDASVLPTVTDVLTEAREDLVEWRKKFCRRYA